MHSLGYLVNDLDSYNTKTTASFKTKEFLYATWIGAFFGHMLTKNKNSFVSLVRHGSSLEWRNFRYPEGPRQINEFFPTLEDKINGLNSFYFDNYSSIVATEYLNEMYQKLTNILEKELTIQKEQQKMEKLDDYKKLVEDVKSLL